MKNNDEPSPIGKEYLRELAPLLELIDDLRRLNLTKNQLLVRAAKFELLNKYVSDAFVAMKDMYTMADEQCSVYEQGIKSMAQKGVDIGVVDTMLRVFTDGSAFQKSRQAATAANSKHSKPEGSRDKAQQIREIWETGKYSNRDSCAEQECAALEMAFSTARKALRGTPNPT